MRAWTDKDWESREISLWVNNDETLYRLARTSWDAWHFFKTLEMIGVYELGGVALTLENVKKSWQDAQAE